jgi:hypothetical protein
MMYSLLLSPTWQPHRWARRGELHHEGCVRQRGTTTALEAVKGWGDRRRPRTIGATYGTRASPEISHREAKAKSWDGLT